MRDASSYCENIGDWVRLYASIGWSTFPVTKKKTPAVKTWIPYRKRLPNEEEIEHWIKYNKDCHLAVATGNLANIAVIDFDTDKTKDAEGNVISWKEVPFPETMYPFPKDTPIARTQNGGKHIYVEIKGHFSEDVKKVDQDIFAEIPGIDTNVDFRGYGGYALVPPFSGYTWEKSPWDYSVAPPPKWFVDFMGKRQGMKRAKRVDYTSLLKPKKQGDRHEALMQFMGKMINPYVYTPDEWEEFVWPMLVLYNAHYMIPPKDEAELRGHFERIATRTIARTDPKQLNAALNAQKSADKEQAVKVQEMLEIFGGTFIPNEK